MREFDSVEKSAAKARLIKVSKPQREKADQKNDLSASRKAGPQPKVATFKERGRR